MPKTAAAPKTFDAAVDKRQVSKELLRCVIMTITRENEELVDGDDTKRQNRMPQ